MISPPTVEKLADEAPLYWYYARLLYICLLTRDSWNASLYWSNIHNVKEKTHFILHIVMKLQCKPKIELLQSGFQFSRLLNESVSSNPNDTLLINLYTCTICSCSWTRFAIVLLRLISSTAYTLMTSWHCHILCITGPLFRYFNGG